MTNDKEYNRQYQTENIVQKKIVFNRKSQDDLILLNWAEQQENFNRYCKTLIRKDMESKHE